MSYLSVYQALYAHYGSQHWWPGDSPFEVMVGAVLTQNTAWTQVEKAIDNLKADDCLTPSCIVAMPDKQLATLIRPAGYFNVKTRRLKNFCRWFLEQGSETALSKWSSDDLRQGLLSVNGVGPETADDMLLYAFDRPIFVIDAYTRRLFSRLGMVAADEGYEQLRHSFEASLKTDIPETRQRVTLFNEYHALIVIHAKDVCRKRPLCGQCFFNRQCPANEIKND